MKIKKRKAGGPKPKSIFDGIDQVFEGADCPYCANTYEDSKPVTQEFLDQQTCPNPGCTCTSIIMEPKCHETEGQLIFYCKIHGTLATFCAKCHGLQAVYLIASSDDHPAHQHLAAVREIRSPEPN